MRRYLFAAAALAGLGSAVFAFNRFGSGLDQSEQLAIPDEPRTLRNSRAISSASDNPDRARQREPRASAGGGIYGLSAYQAEVAAPTLRVLDEMGRTARERGETVVFERVQTERERVLNAAAGLPRSAPTRAERNEP